MTLATGHQAEHVAAGYLQKIGFRIVSRNVRYAFGELDIVACDKKTLVFVEVKYRRSLGYADPVYAVSRAKQKKIILAARAFLQSWQGNEPSCRFDVVTLLGDLQNPKLDHIKNAFWDEEA